jgi:hypothetical protein
MFGAGRELDDEAAGLFDENGEGRFRFNGGSVGAAESGSCFGGMLDSGIAAVAGGSVSEAAGTGTAVGVSVDSAVVVGSVGISDVGRSFGVVVGSDGEGGVGDDSAVGARVGEVLAVGRGSVVGAEIGSGGECGSLGESEEGAVGLCPMAPKPFAAAEAWRRVTDSR